MSGRIEFYRTHEPFGQFSNFFPQTIQVDGVEWPTSEHFFQAAKFFVTDPEWAEAIRQADTPHEAAKMGRDRSHPIMVEWWDKMGRLGAMRIALMVKFQQSPDLYDLLMLTEGKELVEHTANDSYWGDGGDGSGKNMLGKLLMELRAYLKSTPQSYLLLSTLRLLGVGMEVEES